MAGSSATELAPVVAAVAGAIVAEGTHTARAGLRPVSTATTGGMGNPVLSVVEDVTSATLTIAAVVAPILGALLLVALAWGAYRGFRRVRGRISQRRERLRRGDVATEPPADGSTRAHAEDP